MEKGNTGRLLTRLRKELGLTQKELGERLQVSDRTISKWERGVGLPDVFLLKEIAKVFGVEIEGILTGELFEQEKNGGNMKKMTFFVCDHCGSIYWGTGKGEFTCCGRKQSALIAQKMEGCHEAKIEEMDGEWYVSFDHEMSKEHFITFVAWVNIDRVTVVRLYPEQSGAVRLPKGRRGTLYLGCSQDGLFEKIVK